MGFVSSVASTSIPCSKEMTYHAAFGKDKSLRLWLGNTEYLKWSDTIPLYGAVGIGGESIPAGNSISFVQIGRCAQHAPVPAQPLNANVTQSPDGFGLSVGSFIDDSGPGVAHYYWYRNGTLLTTTLLPRIMDLNAPSGGEYTYTVQAEDFHGNVSPLIKLNNPTSEASLAILPDYTGPCPLGPIYDEDNFSPVDGSGPIVPPQYCILPGDFDPPLLPPSSDTPPLPVCTIWAHFRSINTTGGSLAGHGYLTTYRTDTHETRILEGYMDDTNYLKAWNSGLGLPADDPQADKVVGAVPTSTKACAYEGTILGPALTKINNAHITYHLLGPNSNSVWRYLISLLPGFQGYAGFPPLAAVGYTSKLPGVE